ncbi:Aldehyde dehydrogenase PuuC [Planctomycetes bacterium CA13]|uniref:Aldehyde dehydrogenase PuuC n=1 Tax=Novipirellula herctigrandis TaxID=2527986 RepID=A0A5C5YVR3_9BACT|nr:Aldehyde dehydrogenase PuuC [Planctomycetes bacterium CA13]
MTKDLTADSIQAIAGGLTYRTEAFIGGQFVGSASGEVFATENPATGQRLAQIAACDQEDVDRAVASARAAFESGVWASQSPSDRKATLLKFADLIEGNATELAVLDALEAGKPITDCLEIDIPETIGCIRWHAEAVDKLYDQVSPTGPEHLGLIVREPIGVVGAVVPWNFPALMAVWKLGPALASGNSVLLKPAEQTSLSALRLAELAAEAGLPDGVLNVVPGFGETAGAAIGRHMDVDMVAFTGSTEVGRYFLQYAAESNLKRITLECGGKSPQVVMADVADLDSVAENAVNAAFWNMGENCSCGSRLIVHRDVRDALLEKIVAQTRAWTVGDPLDPATKIGSMIERPHMEKVLSHIRAGQSEGAKVVLGGNQTCQDSGGYFVEATIFDDVNNDMSIAREEIFGPVLSTITFDDVDDAIRIANDTSYGLAASLYTDNVHTAHRVARQLKAGNVSVNCYSEGDMSTPFGGYKESGFGGRDNGIHAHDQYTETKTIWMQLR